MIFKETVSLVNGEIVPISGFSEISKKVLSGNAIVILKNVFDREEMIGLRNEVFNWGREISPKLESTESYHRIDENPEKSVSEKILHIYNFELSNKECQKDIEAHVEKYAEKLRLLQNNLTKNNAEFYYDSHGKRLHPQLIQYPLGGGFFEEHAHQYEPQKIGLIVGITQLNCEFNTGSTWFKLNNGEIVSIENEHDSGDIALFRFDLPHGISVVDSDKSLDWSNKDGRWTMVLPYS